MGLPALAGGVVRKFGGRIVRKALRKGVSFVGKRGFRTGKRRGIPSLSASEMGKLMFMSQVLGKRAPAMTLIIMKALRGRL